MLELVTPNRCVHLQWVPSHWGIGGNERSDTIAKEAAVLPQRAPRWTWRRYAVQPQAWRGLRHRRPNVWYLPLPDGRPAAAASDSGQPRHGLNAHQIRPKTATCRDPDITDYMHRIRQKLLARCAEKMRCVTSRCIVCREEADTPARALLRCPALIGRRLRRLGAISPTLQESANSKLRPGGPRRRRGGGHGDRHEVLPEPRCYAARAADRR